MFRLGKAVSALRTRAGILPGASGAVGNGLVGEREGGMRWPGRVAAGVVRVLRFRVPAAQVVRDPADDGGLVDDGVEAQGAAASGTFEGIDLVDLVEEPGPGGAGAAVERGLVPGQGGGVGLRVGRRAALPPRPVAVPAIITDPVLVLVGDVRQQELQPLGRGQELGVPAIHGAT